MWNLCCITKFIKFEHKKVPWSSGDTGVSVHWWVLHCVHCWKCSILQLFCWRIDFTTSTGSALWFLPLCFWDSFVPNRHIRCFSDILCSHSSLRPLFHGIVTIVHVKHNGLVLQAKWTCISKSSHPDIFFTAKFLFLYWLVLSKTFYFIHQGSYIP